VNNRQDQRRAWLEHSTILPMLQEGRAVRWPWQQHRQPDFQGWRETLWSVVLVGDALE